MRITRRRIETVMMTLLCLVLLQAAANFALGYGVKKGFSIGTGCEVNLESPRLSWFPLGGSAENVSIRHASEAPDGGFTAEGISVRLHFFKLFQKQVFLSDLNITGVSSKSRTEKNGFYNTMDFLFSDPPPAPPKPSAWHDALSKDWDVTVREVSIQPPNNSSPNLLLTVDGIEIEWNGVSFSVAKRDTTKIFEMKAAASGFHIRGGAGAVEIPLGTADIVGTIHEGVITIEKALLTDAAVQPEQASKVNVSGDIRLEDDERYELKFQGELFPTYVAGLFGKYGGEEFLKAETQASLSGTVVGELTKPQVDAKLSLEFAEPIPLAQRALCSLRELHTDIHVDLDQVQLANIEAEGVLKKSEISLQFDERSSIAADLVLEIRENSDWYERCLTIEGLEKAQKQLLDSFKREIGSSLTRVNVKGALEPFELAGDIRADIRGPQARGTSELDAKFSFKNEIINLDLKERGERAQASARGRSDLATDIAENIDLELVYNTASGEFNAPKVQLVRFPARRLLTRFAPYIPEAAFEFLSKITTPKSLFDVRGSFSRAAGAKPNGEGEFSLSNLSYQEIDVNSVALALSVNQGAFSAQQINLSSPAGNVSARAAVSEAGALDIVLSANDITLEEIPKWRQHVPGLVGAGSVKATVKGTLENPKYDALVNLTTLFPGSETRQVPSTFQLKGDKSVFSIKGQVLANLAQVDLSYPLVDAGGKNIEVRLDVTDFPIDILTEEFHDTARGDSPEVPDLAKVKYGELDGSLVYTGPRATPLLGNGSLRIENLSFGSAASLIHSERPLVAVIKDGRMVFEDVALVAAGEALTLTGYVDQQGWKGKLSGSWDLAQVGASVRGLEQFSGLISSNVKILGDVFQPRLDGSLTLSKGSISLPLGNTIIGANDVFVEAVFEDQDVRFNELRAKVGEGKLSGGGSIRRPFSGEDRSVNVVLDLDAVSLEPIDKLYASFDGRLAFYRTKGEPLQIAGGLEIKQAFYENKLQLTQILRQITKSILGARKAGSTRVRANRGGAEIALDVLLHADSGILIDTNILQAEMRTDLKIQGKAHKPLLDGTIEVIDGGFGLTADQFEFVTGIIRFTEKSGTLDPQLNIVGEALVRTRVEEEQRVTITITGTATEADVRLSSDGGMSESEILAALKLGGGFTVVRGGKQKLGLIDVFNPRSEATLEERITELTGVSEVSIETGYSEATGEVTPIVTAKRPLVDNIDLRVSSELSDQQQSKIGVEVPLTDQLSAVGGWKNTTVTEEANENKGSFNFGFQYSDTFPGFRLFPPKLSAEEGK